jgi:hypothetical protein
VETTEIGMKRIPMVLRRCGMSRVAEEEKPEEVVEADLSGDETELEEIG